MVAFIHYRLNKLRSFKATEVFYGPSDSVNISRDTLYCKPVLFAESGNFQDEELHYVSEHFMFAEGNETFSIIKRCGSCLF